MKVILLTSLVIAIVSSAECPQKLKNITESDIKQYFGTYYKKLDGLKINCEYDRDSNVFNFKHNFKATATFKKRKLSFDITTHSSIFNLFDFKNSNGTICHSKSIKKKKVDDFMALKKSFFNKFFKNWKDSDAVKQERNGEICYVAKMGRRLEEKKRRSIL